MYRVALCAPFGSKISIQFCFFYNIFIFDAYLNHHRLYEPALVFMYT